VIKGERTIESKQAHDSYALTLNSKHNPCLQNQNAEEFRMGNNQFHECGKEMVQQARLIDGGRSASTSSKVTDGARIANC
jgi:hypothetical protein